MNKVIIIGNVTKDVELKSTQSGIEVCTFTLGVQRNYTNKDGKYDSDFPNFIAYKKTAEIISKYTKKGSKILVEGRIQTRNYEDKSGKKVYVTEIVAEHVTLLDGKKENTATNLPEPPKQEETDPYQAFGDSIEVVEEQQEIDFNENDLPF